MTNNLSDLNGTMRDTSATAPFPANMASTARICATKWIASATKARSGFRWRHC